MNFLNKNFSFTKLDLFVLFLVAFLGVITLPVPFGGDQALFITGAREMANGGVLYRDFWDFKPPGIYYFYYIAGSLFGFSEVGIHLLELLCWLLLSFFLIIAFRSGNVFNNKFSASLVPLLTAGIYYSLTTAFSLTQVEALMNIFIFFPLWLSVLAIKPGGKKFLLLFLSGVLGAVVLFFKLMFLPIIGFFWFNLLLYLIVKQKKKFPEILKNFLLPLTLGLLLPILVLTIYYYKMDLLDTVYKTFFVYPPRLVTEIPLGGYSKLYNLFLVYLRKFYPMLALAVFGAFIAVWVKKNLLLINIFAWFILGAIVILITRVSWWEYHLQLLNLPVGVLFVVSIDFIWSALKRNDFINSRMGKIISILALLVLFQSTVHSIMPKTRFFLKYMSASSEARKDLYINADKDYAFTYKNIDLLMQENSLDGEIYIASTPLFYFLSDRYQGIPINGWVLELLLPEQWDALNDQLKENRPVYLFFDNAYMSLVPNLSPETAMIIKEKYTIIKNNEYGIWFAEKDKLKSKH